MAEVFKDRVKESSTSTGTGLIALAGAKTGFRTFSSVCAVNDTFFGAIVAVDINGAPTGQWEVGYFAYASGNSISRTQVIANSLGTTANVNFAAGSKVVEMTMSAQHVKRILGIA